MTLTLREKIAHLYRRFGFGGTLVEIEAGVTAGLDATLRQLIDYDTVAGGVTSHPYEFAWNEEGDAEPAAYRWRVWWTYAMLITNRPLQEKLAMFWHSHFAVSDSKVEHGLMMVEYLQSLRKRANGKFSDLLKDISKQPAMMRYLDMDLALRGKPNENFAREVMELFTLGIGNYTEKDVQEASRALTGWAIMDVYWQAGKDNTERLMTLIRDKRPGVAFASLPTMRDEGQKTILGVTKDWDGDSLLNFLANRPETATFICRKIWEFFAYENPSPAVVKSLADTFIATKGDIKQVMFALAKHPEFWSERCYLRNYKSPADYAIGLARQMGVGEELRKERPATHTITSRIPSRIIDYTGYVSYRMGRMGLNLLYPEDVSGWKWGKAWINSAKMAERMQYQGLLIWEDKKPVGPSTAYVFELIKKVNPKTTLDVSRRFQEIFDLHLSPDAKKVLDQHFANHGMAFLEKNKPEWFSGALYRALRLLSASPDMHIC